METVGQRLQWRRKVRYYAGLRGLRGQFNITKMHENDAKRPRFRYATIRGIIAHKVITIQLISLDSARRQV